MDNSTFKPKIEFENLVKENLNYYKISKMSFEEYKDFLFFFFYEVDKLRMEGLKKNDVEKIISKNYSDVISNFNNNDFMFERRFEIFNEELIEFGSSPFFWQTDIKKYMEKWKKLLYIGWFG